MKILKALIFSILIGLEAFAFQDPSTEVTQKLEDYYRNSVPLKINLFLNQARYVPGDTIYFKATVVKADHLKALDQSTILNVMLLDQPGNAVLGEKVRLRESHGYNQLSIPPSFKPGRYTLVAYHDWMKNTAPELYFQRSVIISGEKEFLEQPVSTTVSFFPEGGHLIAGVSNKIVVNGTPGTSAKVKDPSGQEVAAFAIDSSGFADFYLAPQKLVKYAAEISAGNSISLPDVENDGIAVSVGHTEDKTFLRVVLKRSTDTMFSSVKLVVDGQAAVPYSANIRFDQQTASSNIPMGDVPGGVNRLTVFSAGGVVLAERLFFVNDIPSIKAAFNFNSREVSPREKVTIKINLKDPDGRPVRGRMAATVFDQALQQPVNGHTIVSNFYLYSDLAGSLTNVLGFEPDETKWLSMIDQLLITRKWQRSPWEEVLRKKAFAPLLNKMHFSGKVITEKTGEVITDSVFVTFFLQKNVITHQTFTQKGKFNITLFADFFGADEVFYRIEKRGKVLKDAKIISDENRLFNFRRAAVAESDNADPYFHFSRQRKLINQSFGFYRDHADYKKVTAPHALIEEEIFGADLAVNFDDYVVFPTMEETLREIVPVVQHRKVRNENVVRVYFKDIDRMATQDPVYIIDGVMSDDTDYFLNLKPTEVSVLKVIYSRDKLNTFGAIGRGGVILVETKIPDHAAVVPRSKNSFQVHGLSQPVSFHNRENSDQHLRAPDLRSALYWAPEVAISDDGEANISFFTSDATGKFQVVIEGITTDGKPFFAEESFTVAFRKVN